MEISSEIPAKKTKRLTSVVWNHFERVRKSDAQYAVCLHCKKKLSGSSNSGTTHLRNHLVRCLKRSNYDVSQILSGKRKRRESNLGPSNLGLTTVPYEEGKIKDEILSPIPLKYEQEQMKDEMSHAICLGNVKFDQERSWLDLARMIMIHGYPPAMIDHVGFKIFVKNLQPMFEFNSSAIGMDYMTIFGKEKQKVFESIHQTHGRINIAVDSWGSLDSSEYTCLTANYIDTDWKLQKRMLNFISLDPSHTEDMLSEVIIKSLTDWAIDRRIFSMTFDECSSADEVMVFRIKDWLSQNRSLIKNAELFDVRCIVHLLKSTVQDVLEAFEDVTCKIRDIIRHTKSEQAILGKFNEIAHQLSINSDRNLTLDSPLRWSSTYMMLEAALEYRGVLCLMQEHDPAYPMALSETEWNWASSMASYMKLLLEFTIELVGNKYPTANIFFPEICDMHIQLVQWCKNPDNFLSSVALKMKNKFETYWGKCSLTLAIAAVLDPRFKMKLVEYYFRQIYGTDASDHIKEVLDSLKEVFNEYSMGTMLDDEESDRTRGSLPSTSNGTRDKLKGFDKFLYETSQSQSMSSDLEKYLEEPVFPRNNDFSVLNWWKVHTPRYPILSMIARDVLAISVSTLGPDVAFSSRGRVLDHCRSTLAPDLREALICGQDWLQKEPDAYGATISSSPLALPAETS